MLSERIKIHLDNVGSKTLHQPKKARLVYIWMNMYCDLILAIYFSRAKNPKKQLSCRRNSLGQSCGFCSFEYIYCALYKRITNGIHNTQENATQQMNSHFTIYIYDLQLIAKFISISVCASQTDYRFVFLSMFLIVNRFRYIGEYLL